jgi:hypothetical protein
MLHRPQQFNAPQFVGKKLLIRSDDVSRRVAVLTCPTSEDVAVVSRATRWSLD